MRCRERGFTLIELLIVIAIIAVLALIAVPNFLEAQVRAKVARCKADMASVSAALECYCVDMQIYPPKPDMQCSCCWQAALSTPIAYLTAPLKDPFYAGGVAANLANQYYQYSHCPKMRSFIFVSVGPDRIDSFDEKMWMCGNWASYPPLYDPTNGTVSFGDIYRVSKSYYGAVPMNMRPM